MNTPVNAAVLTNLPKVMQWGQRRVDTEVTLICALPFEEWSAKFPTKGLAIGAKVKVTLLPLPAKGEPKSVVCELWSAMHKTDTKGVGIIYNLATVKALGYKLGENVKVICEWVK